MNENLSCIHQSKWSHFEENGHCLIIERPDTPSPWENFLFTKNGEFRVNISQRGKGDVTYFCKDANLVGIGRNYCIFDRTSQKCFSLNAGEAPNKSDFYRCEHRPGITTFLSSKDGIQTKLEVVVSPDEPLEINSIKIKNNDSLTHKISLIGYYEVKLNGILNDQQLEKSVFNRDIGAILVQKKHFETPDYKYAAFYISDHMPKSYCGSLEDMFDTDSATSEAQVWFNGLLPNIDAHATPLIQALGHDFELSPGKEITVNYGFGIASDLTQAEKLARDFLHKEKFKTAFQNAKVFFNSIVQNSFINTDDTCLNTLMNIWSKIQLYLQVTVARGAKLHNWRNNLQDSWGWMIFDSSLAKKYLKELCSCAQKDGFLPRSSPRFPEFMSSSFQLNQKHNDIATWAGTVAARYAAETGDLAFFTEEVNYAFGAKKATIINCIINSINWLLQHIGKNGMILLLDGDWSDPLEHAGKKGIGESPWTSVALVNTINKLIPLLNVLGYHDVVREFSDAAQCLAEAVNKNAWDGKWYIRGITDEGIKFCTSSDKDAKVSLMMQAWAIISNVVPPEKMEPVLKAIDDYIITDIGPILYGPPFLKWRPEIGRETVKQPGTGENGSCYVHAAMMLAMAEVKANRPDTALSIIKRVLPLRDSDCCETTRAIPLWMPNFWHGPHSVVPGRSSGIISTGALAWLYLDICDGFFGIVPQIDCLEIKPVWPSIWKKGDIVRMWRNSTYKFHYQTDNSFNGVKVSLDGVVLPNSLLPVPQKKNNHFVEVTIGTSTKRYDGEHE
jgi:cellobiose phosphorylase